MADKPEAAFFFASGGMDGALNPVLLQPNKYARGTNVAIVDQLPTTRPGFHTVPTAGSSGWDELNIQGAIFFNPAKGQSAQSFAGDRSSIMLAAGGRKFQLIVDDKHPANSKAASTDVTGEGLAHDPKFHLQWMYQAENYILSQDGNGSTWIWDGSSSQPFFSKGLNTQDPEVSELANGATVGIYAHGRIMQVVNARQILAGDIVHGDDAGVGAQNILKMTEQVYWASGSYFAPPSSMGNVVAAAILPQQNTQHGHSEVMFHCEDGVFSVNINVYPRTTWTSQSLVRHALLDTGARGPYALLLYDGDQVFRSRHGIQTLRSAAGESRLQGNPLHPISEEVNVWLDNDYQPHVQFTSMAKWAVQRRLFCTTGMDTHEGRRHSRGFVSLNFAPLPTESQSAWEGLWVANPEIAKPIQFVNGVFNGRDRCFCFAEGQDGKNRLFEIGDGLRDDILEDGTHRPISCQLITRVQSASSLFTVKDNHVGTLFLRNVKGKLDWGVWARRHEHDNWTFWRGGVVESKVDPDDFGGQLQGGIPHHIDIELGVIPRGLDNTRELQVLVRWRGYASVQGGVIKATAGDPGSGQTMQTGNRLLTYATLQDLDYDDFENAGETRWEDQTR